MRVIKINDDLKKIRIMLDSINNNIAALLAERIELVKQVGKIKKQKKNYYVPEREKFIFKNLSEKFPEIDKNVLHSVFTEIISGCRSYEKVFKVGLLEDVNSLTALNNILGSFTSNCFFKNFSEIEENYSSLDYTLISLDENFASLVEKIKNFSDIFVINYTEQQNRRFFLLGKIENSDILSGKMGFLLEKNSFAKIKDRLYNHLYNVYNLSDDHIYVEIDFSEKDNIQEIKEIFSVPHKYMGIYPDNNF